MFWSSSQWNPDGLHCYVTGGSMGLGRSLAILLTKRGAHVSIVARGQKNLDETLAEMEKVRQSPSQKLAAYSFSLTSSDGSIDALKAASEPFNGVPPDAIFTCAGTSQPGYLVETTPEELSSNMDNSYWIQAWTAFHALKLMAKHKRKGKIVLVSSTCGYISVPGYRGYVMGKHALRGLGDMLQVEGLLYDVTAHIYFPGTIDSPGFAEETKTKPELTVKIEGTMDVWTPDQCAQVLLRGVEKNQFHITGDFISELFRASTRGATPKNNWILDGLYDFIAFFAIPVWRSQVDRQLLDHKKEHQAYLESRGFYL